MTNTRKTATRRADRREAKKDADQFKPGRGRQVACLVKPLFRTLGLMNNPVVQGDRDSEIDWVEYVWNHRKIVEIQEFVDAEEPGWAAQYKWARSSLLFVVVVSLVLGLNLKAAHTRVRTDPDLRRIGGFRPRPLRRERRKNLGQPESVVDPTFPRRQSVDDFINRWIGGAKPRKRSPIRRPSATQEEIVSERGLQFLALIEKATQEIAFEAILKYSLDQTRLVTDGSIVLSGHARANAYRTDYGADWFTKDDESHFSRLLGTVQLVGAPFVITSFVQHTDVSEPGMLKETLLPKAAEASRRLVQYAADHGIRHTGFKGAAMIGDAAFHNNPCIEATFANGFLPAYAIGGDKHEIVGQRELPVTATPEPKSDAATDGEVIGEREPVAALGELVKVDLRDDGALLCRCEQNLHHETRMVMSRKVERPGRSAYVTCPLCSTTYFMTPRGADTDTAGGERGDIDLRYDVTLPRWDKRLVALSFKARNEIEAMHSELASMELLPDGRGGKSWRSLTGDFRHDFWYGLGHLLWNIRVEFNLSQARERQEYTWAEGLAAYNRNRRKMEKQDELADLRALRAARKRQHAPKYRRKGKHHPVAAHELIPCRRVDLTSELQERVVTERARARGSG